MSIVRWRPVLHLPPGENPMFRPFETWRWNLPCLIRCPRPFFLVSRGLSKNYARRAPPIVGAGFDPTPSIVDAVETDVLFSKTFPLNRIQTVKGKIMVRSDPEEGGGLRWRLVVGCNLEGKWVLHWGVTYCDELGSEWSQPPPEIIPPGSIPIKDYAIETPLKKSSAALETEILHEILIDFDSNNLIAAIHFVIKEEETGTWFKCKGRDFRISLKDFMEEDNASSEKQGFGIWSEAFDHISSILLKALRFSSKPQEIAGEAKVTKWQNKRIRGFYEEYSLLKEEFVQNFMAVTVRKSNKLDKNIVQFDTDIPGDVVVHWGVCKDNGKKWEMPPTPYPPGTKIFQQRALQTLLQPKTNGLGNWGLFLVDKGISGVLFVLKLNEYTWLNNMGTDFYIPLPNASSSFIQASQYDITNEQLSWTEPQDIRHGQEQVVINEPSEASVVQKSKNLSENSSNIEVKNQAVDHAANSEEVINEIKNIVTDISSGKGKGKESNEAWENILQEIKRLAAAAYSIFRSSSQNFMEESVSDAESLKPPVKVCSGTGSGYEIVCQGFNWESHKSGRWYSELSTKAKELSSLGFTIIWLPPPTESVSPEGYMPKNLYDLNSRYGSIEELKDLVKKFHEVGIKVLGDVVLNHRCAHYQNQNGVWNIFGGRLSWDDRAIVADDPHFQGRGNKSSGDNFHAAPNIDHSQEFVRNDLKEWLCWLRREVGYDGWRLDFVRGFWGGYVKEYLEESKPCFAVGEYWDSLSYAYGEMDYNQDAHRQRIIDWINAANGTAGAFDVTTKGILHTALEKCEYWRLSDQKGKPPGVVGWWPSHAVTFLENHDTGSTQGHWRFPSGKEMQGYAYILTHPGTPAVFYDHILTHHQQEIYKLISLRHKKKIHSRSMIRITKAERDAYAAEIDEKVAVKIGPGFYEPSNSPKKWILAAEGKEYKVWEAS